MTREQFCKENCLMCGSQRCLGDDESIAYCSKYKGDIEGIEKRKSLHELFERIIKIYRNKGKDE